MEFQYSESSLLGFTKGWYNSFQKMIKIVTAILGICAYFAICWIRLRQKRPSGKYSDKSTVFDVAKDDFKSITSLITGKKEEKTEKKEQPAKASLRRGGSSNNLKASGEKGKKTLKRQNSSGTIDLHISSHGFNYQAQVLMSCVIQLNFHQRPIVILLVVFVEYECVN